VSDLAKQLEANLKRLRQKTANFNKNREVPTKKRSKPLGYKMQNTFQNNLKGVPGGSRIQAISIRKMVDAERTGCVVSEKTIGVMKSARNANTTTGSYNTSTVEDESYRLMSDAQGRKEFGR
jgi:hypothetical protein